MNDSPIHDSGSTPVRPRIEAPINQDPTERSDWLTISLVFAGGLLAAAQFGKISLTLPVVADAFERSVTQVSVLVSLVGLMGLILGPMAGGIAAGLGIGRTFLIGLAVGGAVSLGQAFMPPFGIMALSRGLEGLAHLALVVAGPPLMAGAASDRARPVVMGLWAVFFGASLALSALIYPGILASGGLPLLFALNGLGLLALAAVLWRRLPMPPIARIELDPIAVHRAIYGRIQYMAPGLGFVCYTFLFIALVAVLPDALGRPALATSLPIYTLLSTLAGGMLAGRFPPHLVVAAGHMGTVVGAGGILLGLPLSVEFCFLFMGLVPGASFASIPAWNPRDEDRARATGALAQMGNLGTVTGTPVFVYVHTHAGGMAVQGVVISTALLGAVLALWSGARATRQ